MAPKYILEQFLQQELLINITEHEVSGARQRSKGGMISLSWGWGCSQSPLGWKAGLSDAVIVFFLTNVLLPRRCEEPGASSGFLILQPLSPTVYSWSQSMLS